MPGRLGIDFGTSNTVLALWDEARKEGVPIHIPEYGRVFAQGDDQISAVPSLIHYAADRRQWIGNQVLSQNLYESRRTFRWMKRYIALRSSARIRIDDREVSHFDAGRDFLSALMLYASGELHVRDEEIAITVPVESFEHYDDWLSDVAGQAGFPRFQLIDEPVAAALGYGLASRPGDVYLVFDFGGGTLDIAAVLIEEAKAGSPGRSCRVLGKAGCDLGGVTLDQWLFQEVLRRVGRSDADEDVRAVSRALLVECERAKERLSFDPFAEVSVMNPDTGAVIETRFSQADFEHILDEHDAFPRIDQAIRRAMNSAEDRGYRYEHISRVLMVGGSSYIPSVQLAVQRVFGRQRVAFDRPLDAIARGAAAIVAGAVVVPYIQHEYAIGFGNVNTYGATGHTRLVEPGTTYPTDGPIAHYGIRAGHDRMERMGIAIFEISQGRKRSGQSGEDSARLEAEIVFDPSGAARLVTVRPDEEERRTYFWMNEHSPVFLVADPPANKDECRFYAEFGIDGNRRLLISVRDLRTGKSIMRDFPVVKLT